MFTTSFPLGFTYIWDLWPFVSPQILHQWSSLHGSHSFATTAMNFTGAQIQQHLYSSLRHLPLTSSLRMSLLLQRQEMTQDPFGICICPMHAQTKGWGSWCPWRQEFDQNEIHFTLTRTTIIKKTDNNRCFWGYGETETLIHHQWDAKWCCQFGKQSDGPSNT